MYVPKNLKWRILIARVLDYFHFEEGNSARNHKRVYEVFAKFLLGTSYDTFLNYLNREKYDISDLKLPSYIVAALGLLDALRVACEHLHARKPDASWTLVEIVEELLIVVRDREKGHPSKKKIHID